MLLKPDDKILYGYSLLLSNIPIYANKPIFNITPDTGDMQCYLCKTNKIMDYVKLGGMAFFTVCKLATSLKGFIENFYFKDMEIFSDEPL